MTINPDHFPSPNQDKVRYNVPRTPLEYEDAEDEELDDFLYPQPDDGWEYVNTVADPPRIGYEDDVIGELVHKVTLDYLQLISFPRYDEFGAKNYTDEFDSDDHTGLVSVSGRTHSWVPFDRTVQVYVTDENMLTSMLIRRWQQEALEQYPLWRMHAYDYHSIPKSGEAEGVMVYPSLVRVRDDCCPPDDLENSLTRWRRYFDEKHGPARRQFREVKRRLPQKVRELELADRPFVVVAGFDNWWGEFDTYTLWVLIRGDDCVTPEVPEDCGSGEFHYVKPDGTLDFSEEKHKRAENADLEQWTFPPSESFTVLAAGRRREEVNGPLIKDGRRWEIPITKADIITDAQLRDSTAKIE